MLDYFAVFTRGGALLWALQFTALRHNPVDAVNALIHGCLLEERGNDNTFTYQPKAGSAQALKWTFHNGLGLVFVAAYQKALSLLYVDELLTSVKAEFVSLHRPGRHSYPEFSEKFSQLLRDAEARAEAAKRPVQIRSGPTAVKANGVASKGTGVITKEVSSNRGGGSDAEPAGSGKLAAVATAPTGKKGATAAAALATANGGTDVELSGASDEGEDVGTAAFDVSKLPKGLKGRGGRGRATGPGPAVLSKATAKKDEPAAPRKKVARNWNTLGGGHSNKDLKNLDYSEVGDSNDANGMPGGFTTGPSDVSGGEESGREGLGGMSRMEVEDEESFVEDDEDLDASLKAAAAGKALHGKDGKNGKGAKSGGLLSSFVSNLAMRVVGKTALAAEDLEPALAEMKRKLMEKNVAEGIAEAVVGSVGRSLEGQKLASFTGVGAFVRGAFEDALSGILNKRSVDVLLDIKKAQARGKPYVIVFCGVNGVGKSTNLAKIAYWLGGHGIKVMIAACDTFRAGAVEQLKTHCARLRVPLYERGYEKDPAKVAYEGARQAERDGCHVLLVDTAGRMQDNEPLMRALSNLINLNEPNLVLFVGEALVGNDAVDQLVKFNRALADLAPPAMRGTKASMIDGIVLTKFDTIDDKVGAAVSMVYSSGAPVMFVGCGQTYVDLKKLNVKSVVRSLLK